MAKSYTREERRNARKFSTRENAATRRELERLELTEARAMAKLMVTAYGASAAMADRVAGAVTAPRGWASV